MKVYGVVYLLIDGTNDWEYVGQTTKTVEKRFKKHTQADSYIGRAIRAHGAGISSWTHTADVRAKMSIIAKEREARKGPEKRSEIARKREAKKSPEQKSAVMKKKWASMSPEERSLAAKEREAKKSPEQKTAAGKKAAIKRNKTMNLTARRKMTAPAREACKKRTHEEQVVSGKNLGLLAEQIS